MSILALTTPVVWLLCTLVALSVSLFGASLYFRIVDAFTRRGGEG